MIARDALLMLAPKVIAVVEPLGNCNAPANAIVPAIASRFNCSPAIPDSQKYGTIFAHCWQINRATVSTIRATASRSRGRCQRVAHPGTCFRSSTPRPRGNTRIKAICPIVGNKGRLRSFAVSMNIPRARFTISGIVNTVISPPRGVRKTDRARSPRANHVSAFAAGPPGQAARSTKPTATGGSSAHQRPSSSAKAGSKNSCAPRPHAKALGLASSWWKSTGSSLRAIASTSKN